MQDSLFKINTKIPKHKPQVPLYSTFHFKSASSKNSEFRAHLNNRLKILRSRFETQGKLEYFGSQYLIKNEEDALEMYTTSDSFWWTNRKYAYSEKTESQNTLPTNEAALESAKRLIKALKIDSKYLKFKSITSNEVAISESSEKDSKSAPTGVSVNFSYVLDDMPLFGSGAKTQLTFSNGSDLVEFLHFYRNPRKTKENISIISPQEAIKLVVDNYRFKKLKVSSGNSAEITNVELGYYTADPSDLQMLLVPVYKITGNVTTEFLKNYKFNLFVIADKSDENTIKKHGATSTVLERVFN